MASDPASPKTTASTPRMSAICPTGLPAGPLNRARIGVEIIDFSPRRKVKYAITSAQTP